MSVKFAPLNIPLERRLQTLSAALWIYTFTIGALLSTIFFIYLFFTRYWPLALLYGTWAYYDRDTPYKGGRKYLLFRRSPHWKYFLQYFPIRLVKEADLKPNKNYIFCVYPHGILSAGIFGNFASYYSDAKKFFPGINFWGATLDIHFRTPFIREIVLLLGGIGASKESLLHILNQENKGNAILLIVGGAAEALYAKPGSYHIILKKRKGFVKVALSTGSSLVPVFSFGEVDVYDQFKFTPGSRLDRFQQWFKEKTGVMLCVPMGRGLFQYSFGIVPRRSPITTVVGKPIDVPLITNPTKEEVQHYHDLFTKAIKELFEEHKGKYVSDPENTALIIE